MSENKEPLNKNNKVPKLRLAKYYGQPIIETNISKIAEINPKCKTLPENFFYIISYFFDKVCSLFANVSHLLRNRIDFIVHTEEQIE